MDCYTCLHYWSECRSDPSKNIKPERLVEKSVGDKNIMVKSGGAKAE
jgi:hypothetical protein